MAQIASHSRWLSDFRLDPNRRHIAAQRRIDETSQQESPDVRPRSLGKADFCARYHIVWRVML